MSAATIEKSRCGWVSSDPLYIAYHDQEWGVPIHDDQRLFEFLCLEGQQAGLSWITVLKKREHYRRCFKQFDIAKVARLKDSTLEKLLTDSGLIRNRLKIYSIRKNALATLRVQQEFGSLDNYLWGFVNHSTIHGAASKAGKKTASQPWNSLSDVPARTAISDAMSKDLKKRGFSFVGSTICYAFMQAAGLVNDHTGNCFRFKQLAP